MPTDSKGRNKIPKKVCCLIVYLRLYSTIVDAGGIYKCKIGRTKEKQIRKEKNSLTNLKVFYFYI